MSLLLTSDTERKADKYVSPCKGKEELDDPEVISFPGKRVPKTLWKDVPESFQGFLREKLVVKLWGVEYTWWGKLGLRETLKPLY